MGIKFDRKEIVIVGTIFLIALFIRLYHLDLTIVSGNDIIREISYPKRILAGDLYFGGVPINIVRHMQVTFGALEYYLLALPMLVSKSPIIISGFIGLLSSFAVFWCYKLCRHFFNCNVAIIATGFYAVNPWAVYYSRFIWSPNFIPFFVILFIYTLFKVKVEDKKWYILGSFASLATLIQFHQMTLLLFPLMILIFKKENMKQIVLGFLVFISISMPYVLHNVIANTSPLEPFMFASMRSQENPHLINIRDSLGIPIMMSTNYYGKYMLGNIEISNYPLLNWFFYFIVAITVVLLLVSIVHLGISYLRKKDIKKLILLMWLIIPILGFLSLRRNISPHYAILFFPLQFIIIAIFVDSTKKLRKVIIFLIILIMVSNFGYIMTFYQTIDEKGGTTGAANIPYKFKLEAAQYIVSNGDDKINIIFLKSMKREFQYIFEDILEKKPDYYLLNSTDELSKQQGGYLIFDKLSMHGYAEKELNKQERMLIEGAVQKHEFGGIVVIKLPLVTEKI